MITYIIKSQGYFRISKTINLETKLDVYRTHNPNFELVFCIEQDIEAYLILKYKYKRYNKDWFILSEEDIEDIRNISYDEIKDECEKIKFSYNRGDLISTFSVDYNDEESVIMYDRNNQIISTFSNLEEASKTVGLSKDKIRNNITTKSNFCMINVNGRLKKVVFKNI